MSTRECLNDRVGTLLFHTYGSQQEVLPSDAFNNLHSSNLIVVSKPFLDMSCRSLEKWVRIISEVFNSHMNNAAGGCLIRRIHTSTKSAEFRWGGVQRQAEAGSNVFIPCGGHVILFAAHQHIRFTSASFHCEIFVFFLFQPFCVCLMVLTWSMHPLTRWEASVEYSAVNSHGFTL